MNNPTSLGQFAVAAPPSPIKEGELVVDKNGTVVGVAVPNAIGIGRLDPTHLNVVSGTGHVMNEVAERLQKLEMSTTTNEVLQDMVAALVAEVNRLEAALAEEKARSGLFQGKYIELAGKVADRLVELQKPLEEMGSAESSCRQSQSA